MKKDKITVGKIAKKAGVSPSTVSRVLNHRNIVKSETIKQVEDAMAALGYAFDPKVSNSPESPPLVVMNIPAIKNVFYQEVIEGARISAKAHGCYILIHECNLDHRTIHGFCNLLHRVSAAGTIITNCLSEDLLSQIQAITPLVQCCEYNEHADFPYVSVDDFSAAKNATEYLLSCGCRKLALINGPMDFKYAVKRKEGFLHTLKMHDIVILQSWIVQLPEVNYEMAYAAICRILNAETRPHAFFTISDIFAAAVIRAAKRFHLKVPNDIMVVGFDNIEFSMMTTPSITTINQPKMQLGYSACEMLLEKIENSSIPVKSLLLDTELIIRESTYNI